MDNQTTSGIYEFVFGGQISEKESLLRFWSVLGFVPTAAGSMSDSDANDAFDHNSGLHSIRLKHHGCESFETGYVRLQLWDDLRDDGTGTCRPIVTGSRWMGLYTRDILQLRDSFSSLQAKKDWNLWLSPLVNAPLANPAPEHSYYEQFLGLRETLVFGDRFRLAFIQRAGFDRPGFGTFDDALPFKNTEGSHANVVQPDNAFSAEFYKVAFDFETAPFGDAHDSGNEPPTIAALDLRKDETFRVERTRAVDCPAGLLQIYSSYMPGDDVRQVSRPGSGNLCAYSVRVRDLDLLMQCISEFEGAEYRDEFEDEFGDRSVMFYAPDGYAWIAIENSE